jgi:crossover junction endodeoxyribonuclease RuvC
VIVVGIDPGSQRTGWAVLRSEGSRLVSVEHATLRLPAGSLAERLTALHASLVEGLGRHRPQRVVLESVFHHKNARSALVLGQARGVALLAAAQSGAELVELSPAEVKRSVTGNGRADKYQVQRMVQVLLGLPQPPATDAADALAMAVAGTMVAEAFR